MMWQVKILLGSHLNLQSTACKIYLQVQSKSARAAQQQPACQVQHAEAASRPGHLHGRLHPADHASGGKY